MSKTILITGSTDGIGKLTAQNLATQGHKVLVHGRTPSKVEALVKELGSNVQGYVADLSEFAQVQQMAEKLRQDHPRLDVLINNAGVLKARNPMTPQGLDLRFVVNSIAPYYLTKELLPALPEDGRVVNLSSAAQALVDTEAFAGLRPLQDMEAYAQSKLAITIWTQEMARQDGANRVFVAVNPGSLLASKMVKEGFGVAGKDLGIGAKILCEAATDQAFASANGRYFDNDLGQFGEPNPGVNDAGQVQVVMKGLSEGIARWSASS